MPKYPPFQVLRGNDKRHNFTPIKINKMKVYSELTLRQFDAWSGAKDTKQAIIDAGKEDDFEALIEDLYPDGIDETTLNDFLWFEDEYLFECLGIKEEEEEEEEEEN